jgi:predicted DNA-binding protein YlxM (UPF0122 family)
MDKLQKSMELNQLYDVYGALLTEKQKNYFEQYYFNDLSLTEISENNNVSRNAVHDQIKRTIIKLYDYEEKLQVNKKQITIRKIIKKLIPHVDETGIELLRQLREVE